MACGSSDLSRCGGRRTRCRPGGTPADAGGAGRVRADGGAIDARADERHVRGGLGPLGEPEKAWGLLDEAQSEADTRGERMWEPEIDRVRAGLASCPRRSGRCRDFSQFCPREGARPESPIAGVACRPRFVRAFHGSADGTTRRGNWSPMPSIFSTGITPCGGCACAEH